MAEAVEAEAAADLAEGEAPVDLAAAAEAVEALEAAAEVAADFLAVASRLAVVVIPLAAVDSLVVAETLLAVVGFLEIPADIAQGCPERFLYLSLHGQDPARNLEMVAVRDAAAVAVAL